MSMYIGGNLIPDGNPIRLNGVQPDKIMMGVNQVWVNNVAPSVIADFLATESRQDGVECTWTNATGLPTPTHDVYRADVLLSANVTSPFLDTSGAVGTPYSYKVNAVNVVASVSSNVDSGTKIPPPFNNVWSGPSLASGIGIGVSGGMCRWENAFDGTLGAWLSADGSGNLIVGTSFVPTAFGGLVGLSYSAGNIMHHQQSEPNGLLPPGCTFNYLTGWVGESKTTFPSGLETSGGQIRYVNGTSVGAWITLT